MDVTRYITTLAIQTKDHKLIPIWDERIEYKNCELYGESVYFKNPSTKTYSFVECVYDLKTKELHMGIQLDYYPVESDLEFKKDEEVFYEKSHRVLSDAKIVDIVYEEFDLDIIKGKKMESWDVEYFKNIDPNQLYAIKRWKPFYVLNDGVKIQWTHQLYHKFQIKK